MKKLLPLFILAFTSLLGFSQNYYRSISGGTYGDASNWQESNDGTNWVGASSAPLTIGVGVTATIRHQMSQFFLNTITINGVLEIDPNGALNQTNNITNNVGSAGIVIKSDASGSGQFLPTVSISVTKEMYITALKWHLIGSPVNGASTDDIFNGCYMQQFDDAVAGGWIWNDEVGFDNTMNRGIGYSLYSPSSTAYDFAGSITASDVTVNLSNADQGYNLVANPFVCAWSYDNSVNRVNVNSDISVWNSVTGSYDTYNEFDGYKVPAQGGFMVRATGASPSIEFNAGNMTVSSNSNVEKNIIEQVDKLVISVQNIDNEYRDAVHIKFDEQGSQNFVNSTDLYKLYGSEESPDLYLISSDEKDLVLKYLPYYLTEPVQLNLKSQVDANYEISIEHNSLSFETDVYLEDTFEDQVILLDDQTAYTFSSSAGDDENRFLLHFDGITGIDEEINNNFAIISSYSNLLVESKNDFRYEIQIVNLLGQDVYKASNLMGDQRINLSEYQNQVLIVNLITDSGSVSKKILIK